MSLNLFLLNLLNFAYIGLLPRLFFKRGSFNRMWWMTGTPFILCGATLILNYTGKLPLPEAAVRYREILEPLSILFNLISIGLISFTLGTHRIPLALWHQNDDAPASIVTYGAYTRIRHPFYASFILAFIGAFLFAPQIWTLLWLLAGFTILNLTAAREEGRLSTSGFGAEYRDYMRRTGRFFPRLLSKGMGS